jgi:hypothetical protein
MYRISIDDKFVVSGLYNTDVYIDDSITTYEVSEADAKKLIDTEGNFYIYQFKNNQLVPSEYFEQERKDSFNLQQKKNRQLAYEKESDPIFMKYQRGEATKEEWEAKVASIAARYQYQE